MADEVAAAKVEIVCVDAIKPANSLAFDHPKAYKVSLLDQIIPSYHFPLVFFYLNEHGVHQNVVREKLWESLSKALSQFYPLAGTISNDGLWIDCNDHGAYYVEAKVINYNLHQLVVAKPDYEFIHKLVPDSEGCTSPIMIQLNFFECGGVALTFAFLHSVMDGHGVREFIKAWASYGKCDSYTEEVVVPNVIAPGVLFPQNSSLPGDSKLFKWPPLFPKGDCVTRRFVFDGPSLLALKEKATSSSMAPPSPTRTEVVSALLWKCAATARNSSCGSKNQSSIFSLVVDLRRRMLTNATGGKIPNIGNLLWMAVAKCMSSCSDYGSLIGYLRESIREIDGGFVHELQGEGDQGCRKVSDGLNKFEQIFTNERFNTFFSSNACGIGFYEADFGWGKPIWVIDGTAGMDDQSFNFFFMDTRHGDGIEVWASLSKQEMAKFECDPEILAFASMDPSPLKIAIPICPNARL